MRVRPAVASDAAALAGIDRLTWTADVSPAPVPEPDRPFFRSPDDVADVLVATDGDDARPVGYVMLGDGLAIPAHAHVRTVAGLAVHPDHAGRGAGRALVEAAVAEARRRGARRLTLRVLGPNAAARRLYASCGFVVEGVLSGEFLLDGRPVDDVLMARRLDDGP